MLAAVGRDGHPDFTDVRARHGAMAPSTGQVGTASTTGEPAANEPP